MTTLGYSALFSQGLMAQHEPYMHRSSSPPPNDTIPGRPTTPPTGLMPPPKITINTQVTPSRPPLRKRRSSLTVAASPMSGVKSPTRSAGMSFSRAILMSPGKRHAHTMTIGGMGEGMHESFTSRMRSGSLGGLPIRPRRAGLVQKPCAPAPTGPLPAPPMHSPLYGPTTAPPVMDSRPQIFTGPVAIQAPQRAPLRRILTDSSMNIFPPPPNDHFNLASPTFDNTLLSPDFAAKLVHAMTTPPASAMHSPVLPVRDVTPLATPLWSPVEVDEAMKEN